MGKMIKTSKELCQSCEWHFGGKSENSFVCCDYLFKTGKRRGCPYGVCDKYKKITNETKKEIPWSGMSNLLQETN